MKNVRRTASLFQLSSRTVLIYRTSLLMFVIQIVPLGTAEISSANYTAREHGWVIFCNYIFLHYFPFVLCFIWCMLAGVKAGMFIKEAKIRCPELVIVPYDFGAYKMVLIQFRPILQFVWFMSLSLSLSCCITCM